MPTLSDRIRRARKLRGLSQSGLAARMGVRRSAVTRWEHPSGNAPSTRHLIEIARCTGTPMEWLALGIGTPCGGGLPVETASDEDARAEDDLELECLRCLRRLPRRVREQLVSLMRSLAK